MQKISLWVFFALLAYMPLHIFLSTWLGTSFGVLDFAKVFKDILLVLGFGCVLACSVARPWFKEVLRLKIIWLIGAYAAITLLLALIKPTDQDAELLGIVYNLRFLLFFVYGLLLTRHYKADWLQKKALLVVLSAAVAVLGFGFVQYMWLPDTALQHVGYARENGVLPAFFIDDKPDLERIMSTVRDPNSLGSYIIIILSLAASFLLVTKSKDLRKVYAGILALGLLCLWFTFSRGAWIGAVVSAITLALLYLKQNREIKFDRRLLVIPVALLVLVGVGAYAAKDSYFVKNVVLHADESTVLEDPNELRLKFLSESVEASVDNPLGYGPGTAGLASVRNDIQGTVLNENYYLQILHEVGVLGLLLFLAILSMVGWQLYKLSADSTLALALFAAFVGLAVTNLLVHIWANEAVAYTWWGLAGLTIITKSHQKNTVQG